MKVEPVNKENEKHPRRNGFSCPTDSKQGKFKKNISLDN